RRADSRPGPAADARRVGEPRVQGDARRFSRYVCAAVSAERCRRSRLARRRGHREKARQVRCARAQGLPGPEYNPFHGGEAVMRITTLALGGMVFLQAQQAPAPTFKSITELVEVDAIVLDKDGNFVPNLTADQITIYENGKPQKIQQFFMVT